jgi:hypothetical protein
MFCAAIVVDVTFVLALAESLSPIQTVASDLDPTVNQYLYCFLLLYADR